jgi:hypothetical protein
VDYRARRLADHRVETTGADAAQMAAARGRGGFARLAHAGPT